jgi:hypothetical protein
VTRLKRRDDAYYAPTSNGIYILTNHGEVMMSGSSIYQWVDRLAPHLDGRHTLAELTAAMPADRRDMTERVITALRERGVVVEAGEDQEPPGGWLTEGERRLYRREIGYLGYCGPSPERSFQAYRDAVAVLAGSGRLLAAAAEAALLSGSRLVRVAVAGAGPAEMSALAECERQARRRDPGQRMSRTATDLADEAQLASLVAGAGVVVYASDDAGFDQALRLDRMCARAGVPFASAILAGGHAWLGPFGPAADPWPGPLSAWRRLRAIRGAGTGPTGPWPGETLTVVANQLIRELVRRLSGTAKHTGQSRMVRIGLRTLRTEHHPFLPHPFSLAASPPGREGVLATMATPTPAGCARPMWMRRRG